MMGRPEPHFSFAGLKTAVLHQARALVPLSAKDVADLCAEFEAAVAESVVDRVRQAMMLAEDHLAPSQRILVVAGGVAANQRLRAALGAATADAGYHLLVPPPALCTDNGAMIAWAGAERRARGLADALDVTARARWPLDTEARPVLGSGRLGTKA
jgi:N6-L-threonylcarbamoyladenine synthase